MNKTNRTPAVKTPKHKQVRTWLLDQIAQEKFRPGDQVPGETAIMALHEVSRTTVRRAMSELEFEGVIHRHQGKGTFLLAPHSRRRPAAETLRWGCIGRHWRAERGSILSGIETLAERTGAELVVEYVGDDLAKIHDAVARIVGMGVTGVIIDPSPYQPANVYQPLVEEQVAIVLLRFPVEGLDVPVVTYDHAQDVRDATSRLLHLKHRRIGYVGSPRYWVIDRQLEGYREAMESAGIVLKPEWVSLEETIADERSLQERGYKATQRLLALPERDQPTAIIALNDETAANVYRAVKSRGLRIPEDISVIAIGSNGPFLAPSLDPALTVWHDWPGDRKLGETAADTLARMHDGTLPSEEKMILVEPRVMPRGSDGLAPATTAGNAS